MRYILSTIILGLFLSSVVVAADAPIEVSADNELTWNRAQKTFTADGNAIITQGADTIKANQIVAKYSEANDKTVIETVTASPNATLSNPDQTLTAGEIKALFDNGVLSNVTATKNVILKTDKETLKGDKAVYNAVDKIIVVTGNVQIEQGQNILTGSRAEFNLNTNISTITASPDMNGGRVKATFFGAGSSQ